MKAQNILCFCAYFLLGFPKLGDGVSVEKDLSLTLSQKNALDKFRERVVPLLNKDYMKTDLYLIRWLRARDFDVNNAEYMLRQNLQWRKDNHMDTILGEDWSDVEKDFPAAVNSYDKNGQPIADLDLYDWDIRVAILQGRAPRVIRYLFHLLENVTLQVFERQDLGLNVTQFSVVGNAEGFNLVQHACPLCIPYWIQFIQAFENNYNGWLDELIIIDAPPTISIILEAVRPFLSRQTSDAFRIFDANKAKWMAYLDSRIDRDQRRTEYGGTRPPPNST